MSRKKIDTWPYELRQGAGGVWIIVNCLDSPFGGGRVQFAFPHVTEEQARQIFSAVRTAFWDGATGVKEGRVII